MLLLSVRDPVEGIGGWLASSRCLRSPGTIRHKTTPKATTGDETETAQVPKKRAKTILIK